MNLFQKIFNRIPWKIAQESGSQSGMGALFGRSSSGKQVNEQTAMQASTVYACVKILAETIASLPLHTYRRTSEGKEKAYDHYLYELLHSQPNPEISAFTFFETMMAQILIWGNAYALIVRDANGKVLELWPMKPDKMQVGRTEGGDLFYKYEIKDGIQTFRSDEILHVPGLAFDGIIGQSPISYAKNAIGMSLAAEEYGSTLFANGANPGGVLEHPGVVKDPKRLRESWESVYRGSNNAHKIAVLEEGMKFSPIGIPPEQAQFLETRKFQTNEICRIFRVPPHMVGDLERATFCLPADVEVYTENGPIKIVDVIPGEYVWSFCEGKMKTAKVKHLVYSGVDEVFTIRTTNRMIRANKNHKILVRRKYAKPLKGRGGYQHIEWCTEYVPVSELRVGDTIVNLKRLPNKGIEFCPTRELTEGFMEFCGNLLGNGTISKGWGVKIARADSAPYMDHYRKIMKEEFQSYVQYTHCSAVPLLQSVHLIEEERQTKFASVSAANELTLLGLSGTAHTKRIPGWVFKTSERMRLAFLRGFLDSDGSVDKKGRIKYFSVSKVLISQIRHLCMGLGIPVTNITKSEACVTLPNGNQQCGMLYTFTCSDPGSNLRIGSNTPTYRERMLEGRPFERKGRRYPHHGGRGFEIEGCELSRITSITSDGFEKVYDLEVEETHSFIANGVIVHNSNIEYQSIEFVVHTIRPWLVRWEQAMKNQLLLPEEKKEYFIRFNVDGLLRGDFKTRQEGYSIGIQNGFLSPNDVRELEDLNLIPDELGGNRHMINGSMIDLKDVGKWADKYSTQKKQ